MCTYAAHDEVSFAGRKFTRFPMPKSYHNDLRINPAEHALVVYPDDLPQFIAGHFTKVPDDLFPSVPRCRLETDGKSLKLSRPLPWKEFLDDVEDTLEGPDQVPEMAPRKEQKELREIAKEYSNLDRAHQQRVRQAARARIMDECRERWRDAGYPKEGPDFEPLREYDMNEYVMRDKSTKSTGNSGSELLGEFSISPEEAEAIQ